MGVEFNAEIIDINPEKLLWYAHFYKLVYSPTNDWGGIHQQLEPNVSTQQPVS